MRPNELLLVIALFGSLMWSWLSYTRVLYLEKDLTKTKRQYNICVNKLNNLKELNHIEEILGENRREESSKSSRDVTRSTGGELP